MKTSLGYVFGIIGTFVLGFLGGWDDLLKLVLLCIGLDYLTGIIKAIQFREVNSKVSYRGIFKKLSLLLFIGFAHTLDIYLFDMNLRTLAIGVVVSHEGLSILENLSKMGVPVPQKIRDVLIQLNKDEKENENE